MEIQKPFKCPVCTSRFTNEDHLQVHKRRHEMSLNLGKASGSLTSQALDSYVEETPSPTRFFRNCEEVGLFQDLQNVNPFDEQFSKAASATPTNENFEFNFSVASSSSSRTATNHTLSMRRSADQDTLNTPQVIGYPTISSTTNTTSIITSVSNSIPISLANPHVSITPSPKSNSNTNKQLTLSVNSQVQNPGISTTTPTEAPEVLIGEIELNCDSYKDDPPSSANCLSIRDDIGRSLISSPIQMKNRSKSNLRLTLTQLSAEGSDAEVSASISTSSSSASQKSAYPTNDPSSFVLEFDGGANKGTSNMLDMPDKKADLLERNRAAASRSRERRKKWINSLEAKNQSLLSSLAQSRSEINKLRAENENLKTQLARHANCDVTRQESKSQQPIILRQSPGIIMTPIQNHSLESLALSSPSQPKTIPALPVLTTTSPKTKRGRPRKGQEKRAEVVCVPSSVSSNCEIPVKVQILPLSHAAASQIVILQRDH